MQTSTTRYADAGPRDWFLIIRHDAEGVWISSRKVTMPTRSNEHREQLASMGEAYSGHVHSTHCTPDGDVVSRITPIDPMTRG